MKKAHRENSQVLCEANYQKLTHMFPEVAIFDYLALENKLKWIAVSVDVLERTPYTVLLQLKSSYIIHSKFLPETTMRVRVYHDARVAEVIQVQGHQRIRSHYAYPNSLMYLPDEKRQSNKLLSDILDFCNENHYKKSLLTSGLSS